MTIDDNLKSPSYGDLEYYLEEKADPNIWQQYSIIISWPSIAKNGIFICNYVFEIIHLDHNNGKSIQLVAKDILSKDTSYHDRLVHHWQQNMDVANKFAFNLGKYNLSAYVAWINNFSLKLFIITFFFQNFSGISKVVII